MSYFWACNPGHPWWRKRELGMDLCYWFVIPALARFVRISMPAVGAVALFGIKTPDEPIAFFEDGHGPLAQLPLWLPGAIFLALRIS